jgi:peroxiredoxin
MSAFLLRFAAAIVALEVAAGCDKPTPDTAPAPASSVSAPAKPPMKPYADPPAARLGQLAPGTGIPVGTKVPDVHAQDLDGHDVSLAALYGKGPILLAFYRGGWCPYCATENHALATAFPEYQRRGVTPVTVSVDKPESEARTKATYTIPFPVLSDSDAAMIEAFHVVNKVDADTLSKMKGFGVNLEEYSGKSHHEIAIPSLFLIDRGGVVRWAHSDPDYKMRPSTAQILAAIDAAHLGGS